VAKYLIKASYTSGGAKGLLKDGASKRRMAAEQALKSAAAVWSAMIGHSCLPFGICSAVATCFAQAAAVSS
jgi:hypothetical protein